MDAAFIGPAAAPSGGAQHLDVIVRRAQAAPDMLRRQQGSVLKRPHAGKVGAAPGDMREDASVHDFQHGNFLGSLSRGRGYIS